MAKKGHKPASTKPAKPPTRARINARAATDPDFRRRALLNPGLRSKLDDKYLTPALATRRTAITEYNKPITEGSTVKTGDVTKSATAATDVEYGPLRQQYAESLGRAQNVQRDTGSFYDQYLNELRQHQSNVQSYQAGAQQALQQTAAGVTGLAGAQGAQLQQAANQQAAGQGVAQAGNLAPMASEAAAAQQQLMASYGAQQAGRGEAANEYASGRVAVGAGQRLSAQAQAAGRVTDVDKKIEALKREEGSYKQKYIETTRSDEAKNVLAQSIAQGKTVADLEKARLQATTTATQGRAKRKVDYAKIRADRDKAVAKAIADSKKEANKVVTTGAFAGKTAGQIRAMTPAQQTAALAAYNKKKGGGGSSSAAGGPDWKTSEATSRGLTQLKTLKGYADKAKAGQAFVAGHQPSGPLPRNGPNSASAKIQAKLAPGDDPVLLTAALDAAYDRRLSAATIRQLIAAGYKPSRVAATLGVPTAGQAPPRPKPRPAPRPTTRNPGGPRTGPAASIPGLGGGRR